MSRIQNVSIETAGDRFIFQFFSHQSSRDIGYSIKQILQGCDRSTPFGNKNVVATVGFMSVVGVEILKEGSVDSSKTFNELKSIVCGFADGRISWSEIVKVYWSMQSNLNISNQMADAVITYLEEMAYEIMDFAHPKGIRQDLHWSPVRFLFGK